MSTSKGRAGKTRERILRAALDLFNSEGVERVSAVDVASALGISPGHLYYHFKGKEQLLGALYVRHEEELMLILEGADKAGSLEAVWTHVQIILEEIHDARFFYAHCDFCLKTVEGLKAPFRRVVAALRRTVRDMLGALTRSGALQAREGLVDVLTEQTVFALLHRLNFQTAEQPQISGREQVAAAALFVMTGIAGQAPER